MGGVTPGTVIRYKKIITWFLITLLISQEIFRIPYSLSSAEALEVENHENIVSLIVEENLFSKIQNDIQKYALRVQSVLPRTRTVILTFPADTHPVLIASANERLYYSGLPNHGNKTQKLVGTILIGDIPLPVVHKNAQSFLSVFPYIDFDEPSFVWNWDKKIYEYLNVERKNTKPELWHSVIAPHSGNLTEDARKIQDFFARVYQYDKKEGDYADIGEDPQVFYADSIRDARATSSGLFAAYEKLFVPNQEHFEYHRYTKEFAKYLYENYLTLMKNEGTPIIKSFSEWVSSGNSPTFTSPLTLDQIDDAALSSSSFLSNASDISTRIFAHELIPDFLRTLSEKYIGDITRWVHQSGRYYDGYSQVRLDTMPELIQQRDAISSRMLREVNDSLEVIVNNYIEGSLSLDIPILVTRNVSTHSHDFTYTNYFFGKKASSLKDASECSILRGSTFGSTNTVAEMNHGYHVQSIESDADIITGDVTTIDRNYRLNCINDKVTSYWGGNTPMNLDFTSGSPVLKAHTDHDFSRSIYDPAGGKKITGQSSPFDCLKTDLLLEPYVKRVPRFPAGYRVYEWPKETQGTRYSCATNFNNRTEYFDLNPSPETNENIFRTLSSCQGSGNISLLGRNGTLAARCTSASPSTGTYKLTSSLIKHVAPDTETYGKQLTSLATPNLPVDENRHVVYINRQVQEKRVDYPNVFDIQIPIDATDAVIKEKIQQYLRTFDVKLDEERRGVPGDLGVLSHLVPLSGTKTPISLAAIVDANPDLENNLVASLRWKNLPTAMKYQYGILDALKGDKSQRVALFGDFERKYEISYIGGQGDAKNLILGYQPTSHSGYPSWYQTILDNQDTYQETNETSIQTSQDSFTLSSDEYDQLFGTDSDSSEEDGEDSESCDYDNAVVIWEWLSAIQCWLKNLFNTEWESGESDFSFDWEPYLSLTLGSHTLYSTDDEETLNISQSDTNSNNVIDSIENSVTSFSLRNTPSSYVLEPKKSITLNTYLQKGNLIAQDSTSHIELIPLSIHNLDTGKKFTPGDPQWETIRTQSLSLAGSSQLTDGRAVWTIRSLTDDRMAFEFVTRIKSGTTTYVTSSVLQLSPESKFPSFTLLSSNNTLTPSTVRADDAQGITILFQSGTIPTRVDVDIREYITNKNILSLSDVPVTDKILRITSPAADPVLHKAGKYVVTLTNNGIKSTTDLYIIPGAPKKIISNLPKILLVGEKYTTSFSLTDNWGNNIDASSSIATIRTSQSVISGQDTDPKREFTLPLSKKFQFQPLAENTITFDVALSYNQENIEQSFTVTALADVKMDVNITQNGAIRVGQKLPVEFIMKTQQGTPIVNWDIPVRIGNKGTGAHLENPLVTFSEGKGKATFITGTQAGKTSFYFSETTSGKKIGSDIEIAPDVPSRLTFSGPKMLLARTGQSETLAINIFDKYGNYIHPSQVDVRMQADVSGILEPLGSVRQISDDIYGVLLKSRGYPGRVLLRGAVYQDNIKSNNPALENVWEVNVLPVITSDDIERNTWNALTHVLLGGPFGQFVTRGYFAGNLLFAPKTQALSISTLVDRPRSGLFSLGNTGAINILSSPHLGAGLEVQWQSHPQGLFALLVSDKRLGSVAKITYPRLTNSDRITFLPATSDTVVSQDTLLYRGTPITGLRNIFENSSLSFTFVPSSSDIRFNVRYQDKTLGTLVITYASRKPSTTGLSTSTYSLEMLMSNLLVDTTWGGVSSLGVSGVIVFESSSVSSFVGGPVEGGYSSYPEKYGMGWTGSNLGLLQFASGESFAQAQQHFGDYVTINLGDALIQLPEYKVNAATGFDATIGVPVYTSSESISDFNFSDINNDQSKDIVVTDTTNTLSVGLSKKDGSYLDMGEFLSLQNAREGTIRSGDFFQDGYMDIVYVDTGGILHIVSHDIRGSREIDLISDRNHDIGQVTQIEVFDMDHDGHDDIVILDTLGQLSIFYGASQQRFVYQFVDHVFDFAFADTSLFSGAIYYEYPGFRFPDFSQTQDTLLRSQQEQLQSVLFTSLTLSNTGSTVQTNNTSTSSLGDLMSQSFTVDENAGAGTSLSNIAREYNSLASQYGTSARLRTDTSTTQSSTKTLLLLKAPFINKNIVSITKKYTSLETDGVITQGAQIQGAITIKNTSAQTLSKVVLLEKIPSYLQGPITTYSLKKGGSVTERALTQTSEGSIIDLRDVVIAPGETIQLVYTAKMATFSFGSFDVGYLEDAQDPLLNIQVPKDKILTIHPTAKNLDSIPERDFYGVEKYGDIRINPNNTCGGPLFLWRSHNTFDRTYQKTLIVRDIPDPQQDTMDISNNPLDYDDSLSSSLSQNITTTLSQNPSTQNFSPAYKNASKDALKTYNTDSDGDDIPDKYDDDPGDIFSIQNSGNSTQITVGLGKLDETLDTVIEGVETFISGLSCGFGDAGCIAQPMNWTANVPGNTITALGYAVPGVNQAPIACYKDVRCGVPIFSFPTAEYPYFWPPNPDKAGGAFDAGSPSIASAVSQNTTFTGGYGVSQFRLFIGATLTGAVAEVLCFGPNNLTNPIINLPGLFPIAFQGNCIYATQPLTQCSDDGSDDIVTELEIDESSGYESDDFQVSDGDSCGFFTPVTAYPDSLIQAVNAYLQNPTTQNLTLLRQQISQYASIVTGSYSADTSLLFTSSSPYSNIQSTSSNSAISFPQIGDGNGVIKITLDSTSFDVTSTGPILDVNLKSISAFPRFIMDWYHRQLDEIVSSLGSLPDIKIFLPDLGSGFADGGWIPEFNNPNTGGVSSSQVTNASSDSDVFTPLDVATDVRNTVVSGIQGGVGSIQAAFEYLSLLPMIDVHPEVISLNLPWMDRSAMQSWIYRNEAILAQWEALPQNALGNAVNTGDFIASIRSNIETVRSYMTLPEQLQNLFYLKEKFLYEILKNVYAIQKFMGGWLYDNGERFKTWVETFILITRLWDLWQVLIDVFDDYEESCAVCHNEQWNLQEWLWIIISAVIPPIPVIKMPKWPDIELDFSDIDLGIDIAYPVFNFSFYPLDLPDMPSPSFSGLNLDPIPQLPPLPDLNLDFEIPTIQLPQLPNLPPAPLIPELSQSISVVLKIFKIVTLIQCLYRQMPLSPEWYVGTKIAHKTDRQGYLPIDFLNVNMPSVVTKWVDAIRVSAHVDLTYDVDFIIEMIESILEPLEDFPRDLSNYTGDLPSSVDIDLDTEDGDVIQTSSLDTLPGLIGQLYTQTIHPDTVTADTEIQSLSKILATHLPQNSSLYAYERPDTGKYYDQFQEQITRITHALQEDIDANKVFIADLSDLSAGKKDVKDIAWIQHMNPHASHLAASVSLPSTSSLLDVVASLKSVSDASHIAVEKNILSALTPSTAVVSSPTTTVTSQQQNSTKLTTSKGLYITKNGSSQRLHYFYEDSGKNTTLHMIDDDGDGDRDIFYILGNSVYRKENHKRSRNHVYITDMPQIFTARGMMRDFFGQNTLDITTIPHDMQISLRESHGEGNIYGQYIIHQKTSHHQFDIFRTLGENDPRQARYRIDSIAAPENIVSQGYSILPQPVLSDVSGQVLLQRKKIYRTLLPNAQYTEGTNSVQDLPSDFVIRAKKMGYTKESTVLEVSFGNQKREVALNPGEVLLFAQDSSVVIKRGSLILPSDEYEQNGVYVSDQNTPLFPGDTIETRSNGSASVVFHDNSETDIFPDQIWSLIYHNGLQSKIQDFVLSVDPGWYYGVARDALSNREKNIPRSTLFDTHTESEENTLVDTLPTTLHLDFDTPTEIDFQDYFPSSTLSKVEVTGISPSLWQQLTATKILFQTSQEDQRITLRVTSKKGIVYMYTLTLVTKPATLTIQQVDTQRSLVGSISSDTRLPITIQSFTDGKTWTLSTPLNAENRIFTTSFATVSPEWNVSYAGQNAFSVKRDSGFFTSQSGLVFEPDIRAGQPITLKALLNQKEISRIQYRAQNLLFQQVASQDAVQKNTLTLISPTLRLEPAVSIDTSLKGGAYIVGTDFKPVIAFDASGVVRYLDTNLRFRSQYQSDALVLSLTKEGNELGKIVISGDMLTAWDK